MVKRFSANRFTITDSRQIDFLIILIGVNVIVFTMINLGIFDIINANKVYYVPSRQNQNIFTYIGFSLFYCLYRIWVDGYITIYFVEIDYDSKTVRFDYSTLVFFSRTKICDFDDLEFTNKFDELTSSFEILIKSQKQKIKFSRNKKGWDNSNLQILKKELKELKMNKNYLA
jgi:hypothetical protein